MAAAATRVPVKPRAVPTMKPARRPIRRISSEAGMVADRVPRTMVETGSVASAGPASAAPTRPLRMISRL